MSLLSFTDYSIQSTDLAPEAGDNTYGSAVDIYSFSFCLFEMQHPFPTDIPRDGKVFQIKIFTTVFSLDHTYVSNVRNGWRPPLPAPCSLEHCGYRQLIEQGWAHDPTKRPSARQALGKLFKILPCQFLQQQVKDGHERIRLLARGEEFIARRSTLALVRQSCLWEFFGGGKEKDPPANADGFIELAAGPKTLETALSMLVESNDFAPLGALRCLAETLLTTEIARTYFPPQIYTQTQMRF